MITDMQLGALANILGISMFILVILYHFIHVNYIARGQPSVGNNKQH